MSEPIAPASLFVATAAAGFRPTNSKAGNEIKPPPPTTESTKAARNPNEINSIRICTSTSKTYYTSFKLVTTEIVTNFICAVNPHFSLANLHKSSL